MPLMNKGRFCNNTKINTLISKRLSIEESKAKLSQLGIVNKQYYGKGDFDFPVERVSLCFLQIIALKSVLKFRYCFKICPC